MQSANFKHPMSCLLILGYFVFLVIWNKVEIIGKLLGLQNQLVKLALRKYSPHFLFIEMFLLCALKMVNFDFLGY